MSFATAQSRIEVEARYIASTGIPYYQAVQIARENEAKRNAKRLADAQKKREEQSARRATVAEKQQEPRKKDLNKEIQRQQEEYAKAIEERNRLNRERKEREAKQREDAQRAEKQAALRKAEEDRLKAQKEKEELERYKRLEAQRAYEAQERDRLRQLEVQRQKEIEEQQKAQERDRLRQLEVQRQKEIEEQQRIQEQERLRQLEVQRQKEIQEQQRIQEQERLRQLEVKRQKEIEEQQKAQEQDRLRQLEVQRQKEIERQRELERQDRLRREEILRQREIEKQQRIQEQERLRQEEIKRNREIEEQQRIQEQERLRQLEVQRQKEIEEQQRIQEQERLRQEQIKRNREIEKQQKIQEVERQRQLSAGLIDQDEGILEPIQDEFQKPSLLEDIDTEISDPILSIQEGGDEPVAYNVYRINRPFGPPEFVSILEGQGTPQEGDFDFLGQYGEDQQVNLTLSGQNFNVNARDLVGGRTGASLLDLGEDVQIQDPVQDAQPPMEEPPLEESPTEPVDPTTTSTEPTAPTEPVVDEGQPEQEVFNPEQIRNEFTRIISESPNLDESEYFDLFFKFSDTYSGDPSTLTSEINSFLQEEEASRVAVNAEEALYQSLIDAIKADPLNPNAIDFNSLTPEMARRVTQFTNDYYNSEEFKRAFPERTTQSTEVVEEPVAPERQADVDPEVVAPTGEEVVEPPVPPAEEEVVEPPLTEGEVVEPPPVEEDVTTLPVEEDVTTPPVEEDVTTPPVEDEQVVVTNAANDDIVVTNTPDDMDEFVSEIVNIIDTMSIENVEDLDEIKSSLVGVFEDYKQSITSLADAEAAKNIINQHIDTILSNALQSSENLFVDFDEEEAFGRPARSGIELSMERIIDQIDIDRQELVAKATNLVNMRYDQAYEALARKGLLEGGGISASGGNIRSAQDLESQRAIDLAEKEIEVDEKLRAELKDTLTLLDAIQRSRTEEEVTQQGARVDTTQQLLDFVIDLENLRLSERQVSVTERGMTLEEYRQSVEEKIAAAQLTGELDGEQTIALREMLSRVEIENRKLDLEQQLLDNNLSISERTLALNELTSLRQIELEAKRFNLEEALGLRGMSLQERRLILDELLGEAGVDQAERELVLKQLLGEGDLAIRRELAGAEIKRIDSQTYIEEKRLLLDQLDQEFQEGIINRRIYIEEQRLELDRFVESNRVNLEKNNQRIQEKKVDFDRLSDTEKLELESELGFQRLALEGERIDIEDRRLLLEDFVSNTRLTFEERQITLEELIKNQEIDLAERAQYAEELFRNTTLTQRDQEIAVQTMLANASIRQDDRSLDIEERKLEVDEMFRIAEATGFIIDQNGFPVMTVAAKAQESADRLAQAGLDIEAAALRQSADQFNRRLEEDIRRATDQFNLDSAVVNANIAEIYSQMSLQRDQLNFSIEQSLHDQHIDLEELGLRRGELDLSRLQITNREELERARLNLDTEILTNQIYQQELDRAFEQRVYADKLEIDIRDFNQAVFESDRAFTQSAYEAAQEFGLAEDEFALAKFQIEQDVRLRQMTIEDSAAQWAQEFGLDYDRVTQAMRHAEGLYSKQIEEYAIRNNLSQTQLDSLTAELNAYQTNEARRDEIFEEAMNGDLLNTKEGRRKFADLMVIINGGGSPTSSGGGGSGDGGGGIGGFLGNLLGDVGGITAGTFGAEWARSFFRPKTAPSDQAVTDGASSATTDSPGLYSQAKNWYTETFRTKGGPLDSTAGRVAGAAVMIYSTYKMADNLRAFYGGEQTQKWTDKGWFLPTGYGVNFVPNEVDEGRWVRENGSAFINWQEETVNWSIGAGESTQILYTESLDDYNKRSNKVWLPIQALKDLTGYGKGELKSAFGLNFHPSYVWIDDEGLFFAGSRTSKGTFKNSQFVERSELDEDITFELPTEE